MRQSFFYKTPKDPDQIIVERAISPSDIKLQKQASVKLDQPEEVKKPIEQDEPIIEEPVEPQEIDLQRKKLVSAYDRPDLAP